MNAIDTNIWVYSHDTRDSTKQQIADRVIDEVRPMVLLWQIGCEFLAACRKLEPAGFTKDDAWDALGDMQAMSETTITPVAELWPETKACQERYSLSFWDALLIATCIRAGVQILYTENMGAPRTIDGLALVNPFLPKA